MTNEINTWVVIAFATLGVAAAIAAFIATPRERRYRVVPRVSLEEQLKNCPESAQAVIIKGNKRRALLKSAPYILVGFVLVGFALWNKNTSNPECVQLLGLSTAYVWLLLLFYGLPIGCFILSLLFVGTGIKTIKMGYFPPLESVVFRDTIAKKGTISKLRGFALITLPVFTLCVMYFGINAYMEVADGKNIQQINEKLMEKC